MRRGYLLVGTVHIGLYSAAVLALYTAIDLVGGWLALLLDVLAVLPSLALGAVLAVALTRLLMALPDRG